MSANVVIFPGEWVVDETREAERISTWDNPQQIIEAGRHPDQLAEYFHACQQMPPGRRVNAPTLSVVEPEGDALIDHGDAGPLIPEGLYNAVYGRHEVVNLRRFGNATKLFIWFRIVDPGPAFGIEIYRAYRVAKALGKRRFVVKRDSELLMMPARALQIKRNRPVSTVLT